MGKGSSPRPFTDREVFESNFDKIFRSKKPSDDVSPHTLEYEYELNKSTGNVEKTYSRIDVIFNVCFTNYWRNVANRNCFNYYTMGCR